MSPAQSIFAFAAAATLVVLTPGIDTALVLRAAMTDGRRCGLRAAIGVWLGCIAWGVLVAIGLGAVVAASPAVYGGLRWLGAAYLAYLGLPMMFSTQVDMGPAGPTTSICARDIWLRRGFLTNMLNPKAGIFYLSFLPQFIPPGTNVPMMTIGLACLHATLSFGWFSVIINAACRTSGLLVRPRTSRYLNRVVGGVFLVAAGRLFLEAPR